MTDLVRVEYWLGAFCDTLDAARREPHVWNGNDCAMLAGRNVYALTGVDLFSAYGDKYHDAASGFRLIRKAGFANLADFAASHLPEYAHPSEAQTGDIAAIPIDTVFGYLLGIFDYDRIWAVGENGLHSTDRTAAARAFKVG